MKRRMAYYIVVKKYFFFPCNSTVSLFSLSLSLSLSHTHTHTQTHHTFTQLNTVTLNESAHCYWNALIGPWELDLRTFSFIFSFCLSLSLSLSLYLSIYLFSGYMPQHHQGNFCIFAVALIHFSLTPVTLYFMSS